MGFNRRKFIQATARGSAPLRSAFRHRARAGRADPTGIAYGQDRTARLGGLDMERALLMYMRERNNTIAGARSR